MDQGRRSSPARTRADRLIAIRAFEAGDRVLIGAGVEDVSIRVSCRGDHLVVAGPPSRVFTVFVGATAPEPTGPCFHSWHRRKWPHTPPTLPCYRFGCTAAREPGSIDVPTRWPCLAKARRAERAVASFVRPERRRNRVIGPVHALLKQQLEARTRELAEAQRQADEAQRQASDAANRPARGRQPDPRPAVL